MALNATQPALHCISVIELPALLSEEKAVLLENQHLSHVIQARKESKLKVEKKDYNEVDMAKIQKMKEEEKTLREFRAKAQQKGTLGDARLKKRGKK
ncbi:uncharacterized protein LOC111450508 [Cucurbita moschata]|uniref:Uncharacterized protein LOC111450508 n=1 Tax=Cucurbita moschata TaxID=3662 RepID=A0A6J1G3X1_CUCMO|nr:uncharacterized protein LOC111450508 [Cucurbita moschata]